MISFIFNTKSLFNEPWMASSPRDFWSTRWQLFLNETFKELGFLPVKNLLNPFVPRKIANMMGVLGAFAISSYLLHEYIIIGNYNIWTVFPAFIEPSLRNYKLSSITTFTTVYVQRFINNL
ncbi:unnamed protein product [Rhizophagus irregularis]|nr:hypothetical protein RhiirB3_524640 [Rhizophagus irregularis]CAB5384256.1 unnamed protein product [Rhizophagus irregularis]